MNDHSRKNRICVVGSANVDLTFRAARLPEPGETLFGSSMHQGMGGKGANQAVAAARLGADVTFVARIGSDFFGTQAMEAYNAEGINTSFIQQDEGGSTGTAGIFVRDDAENRIIVVPGANARLDVTDVQAASSVIEESDAVLCQLETPVNTVLAAFKLARASGVLTMLTPAPADNVPAELLALCDVCVPNKTEIETLTGQSIETDQDAIHAAELLRHRGVKNVTLTMGSQGVFVVDDNGPAFVPAMVVEAVDTTGAGDAFAGALALGLAEGLRLVDAARRAAVVAALSVTRPGAQASFPSMEEVRERFKW